MFWVSWFSLRRERLSRQKNWCGLLAGVGRSGDGGIDGLINEDRLELDIIYIQAKRWESSVDRSEIQKFAGALQGVCARKGIFVTTSGFTSEAKDFLYFCIGWYRNSLFSNS